MDVLYLREDDVASLVTVADAIAVVEAAFKNLARNAAEVRPRQRVRVPGGMLHVMPAGISGGNSLGLKVYTTFTQTGARFMVILYDARDGTLRAIIQGDRLGQIRTGAATGVATRYMAREDSHVVGLFGSGWQAQTQLQAVCAVRSVQTVRVFGRSRERLENFCSTMGPVVQATLEAAPDPRSVVVGADIVITITSSATPVFEGSWLAPGTHVNAAGVNQAAKREIDELTVTRAKRIVTDLREQAQLECGDLIPVIASGALGWDDVLELGAVVNGTISGRIDHDDVTLFESQGIALEDVALAELVYARAIERGVGVWLPL